MTNVAFEVASALIVHCSKEIGWVRGEGAMSVAKTIMQTTFKKTNIEENNVVCEFFNNTKDNVVHV